MDELIEQHHGVQDTHFGFHSLQMSAQLYEAADVAGDDAVRTGGGNGGGLAPTQLGGNGGLVKIIGAG